MKFVTAEIPFRHVDIRYTVSRECPCGWEKKFHTDHVVWRVQD